jgi:hypothetical protein
VARYLKRYRTLGSLGPTEERDAGLWIGYDIEGFDDDLSHAGLIRADELPPDEIARRGVAAFTIVAEDDEMMRRKLGIRRSS